MSAALNNFAFVLFKADMPDKAGRLCRSHYRALAPVQASSISKLAIQPWINEGRMLVGRGCFDAARQRLLLGVEAGASSIRVDKWVITDVDTATTDVCRNVAIVDGFFLEIAANGLDAAKRHLTSFEGCESGAIRELLLQAALAQGRPDEAEATLTELCRVAPYLPAMFCYAAAIAAARGDGEGFAKSLLLLVALLSDWAESVDDRASILHGLLWLSRLDGRRYWATVSHVIAGFIQSQAAMLGDEELKCRFAQRRYQPIPPDSLAFRRANEFLDAAMQALPHLELATGA